MVYKCQATQGGFEVITPDGNRCEWGKSTAGQVKKMCIDKSLQEHTFRQESSEGRWLLLHLLGVVNSLYSLVLLRFHLFYRHFVNCMALAL